MKLRKPLQRVAMKPRAVQMKQGAKLPAQSKRTKQRVPERAIVRQVTIERSDGRCEGSDLLPSITCRGPMDVHETLSRARSGGKSQYDPFLTMLLCRAHHDWVTTHPAVAAALGLSLPSGPCAKSILLIDREESG